MRILFSGGGSTGHIAPALAVLEALEKKEKIEPLFACSNRASERQLLEGMKMPYRVIHAGKFPSGFSIRWITFPFLFAISLIESLSIVLRFQPQLMLSKGGYVSVPVCIIGWIFRIPIVLHESDAIVGLSNRLIARMAKRICTGFPRVSGLEQYSSKTEVTGNPVRSFITSGKREAGLRLTGFSGKKPVLMIIGGSQGALSINQAVGEQFGNLIDSADIIHLTGEGKMLNRTHAHYYAKPYVTDDLPNLYAIADIIISRAGAGTLSELSLLKKPVIVIPLGGIAQDHQVKNAQALEEKGAIIHLPQRDIGKMSETMKMLIVDEKKRKMLAEALSGFFVRDAGGRIAMIIVESMQNKATRIKN